MRSLRERSVEAGRWGRETRARAPHLLGDAQDLHLTEEVEATRHGLPSSCLLKLRLLSLPLPLSPSLQPLL